jgi:hypothetical protein
MNLNFYPISTRKQENPPPKPYQITVRYFMPLTDALDNFEEKVGWRIDKLYNIYGQEVPLTYKVQKSNIDFYFDDISQQTNT